MFPESWQTTHHPTYTSTHGIGQYLSGTNSSGGAALRGGNWNDGPSAGAFSLNLRNAPTDSYTDVGFRCVYRP